jgi:branched-chain amino acid transport system ATP-binding protein
MGDHYARHIGDILLKVDNVSCNFGGVRALTNVSFQVRENEICSIIGPNGAGKSCMLNCITGVYRPIHGTITFKGNTYNYMQPNHVAELGIARTFQNIALFRGMTVLANLMTGRNFKMRTGFWQQAIYWGPARKEEVEQRRKVEEIIHFLEIESVRKTLVSRLPYGLQKRVELGRALASDPKLLLLDEPMTGMNPEEKQDICRFILDANEKFGITVVLIEHDMGVVMDLSDRLVVLVYGDKIAEGTPDEVRKNPEVIAAYLGTKAGKRTIEGDKA